MHLYHLFSSIRSVHLMFLYEQGCSFCRRSPSSRSLGKIPFSLAYQCFQKFAFICHFFRQQHLVMGDFIRFHSLPCVLSYISTWCGRTVSPCSAVAIENAARYGMKLMTRHFWQVRCHHAVLSNEHKVTSLAHCGIQLHVLSSSVAPLAMFQSSSNIASVLVSHGVLLRISPSSRNLRCIWFTFVRALLAAPLLPIAKSTKLGFLTWPGFVLLYSRFSISFVLVDFQYFREIRLPSAAESAAAKYRPFRLPKIAIHGWREWSFVCDVVCREFERDRGSGRWESAAEPVGEPEMRPADESKTRRTWRPPDALETGTPTRSSIYRFIDRWIVWSILWMVDKRDVQLSAHCGGLDAMYPAKASRRDESTAISTLGQI